jgi:integrase
LASGPPDAETYKLAVARFAQVVQLPAADPTIASVITAYLTWLQKQRSHNTYQIARYFITQFPSNGRVRDLRPQQLYEWLDSHGGWKSPTTRNMALRTVYKMVRWGVKVGVIPSNPLAGRMDFPTARRRESLISAEEHAALLAVSPQCERDLWSVLWMTGARPGEVSQCQATHWNRDMQAIVIPGELSKTRRDRVIFLPPECVAIVERLVAVHPQGAIFQTVRGLRWSATAVARQFNVRRHAAGLRAGLSAYSYRHAWATNALIAGEPVAVVAELLGTSVTMLARHYGHIGAFQNQLREVAMRIGRRV